jgi:hypothetical protein
LFIADLRASNKTSYCQSATTGLQQNKSEYYISEGEPQPELDLSGSTERVDPGSDPRAISIVATAGRVVDLFGGSGHVAHNAACANCRLRGDRARETRHTRCCGEQEGDGGRDSSACT